LLGVVRSLMHDVVHI